MGKRGTAGQLKKNGGVECGARKRRGAGKCQMAAGWGTNHPGTGRCKLHAGSTPAGVKAAASEEYRKLLGNPIEINPLDALLWCIKIRAGEVQWLTERIADLEEKEWIEETIMGKAFHMYARERQHAMQDLARYSQMAVSLGIAERAVKLAETYGEMLASLIQGILADLDLSKEQRAKAPSIVRKHLILIDGGLPADPPQRQQLEAGSKA